MGLVLVVIGVGTMLLSLQGGNSLNSLVIGLVLAIAGAVLIRQHAFHSSLFFIHVKGEAYRSGLAAGTRMPTEVADTQRLSVISELRLSLYGAAVESRNTGDARICVKSLDSAHLSSQFQVLLDDVANNVLPKILLQKSWEQSRHEYSTPMIIKQEVRHEIWVKCGHCQTLNVEGERVCQGCGARLH
jgi:hypothetical protein